MKINWHSSNPTSTKESAEQTIREFDMKAADYSFACLVMGLENPTFVFSDDPERLRVLRDADARGEDLVGMLGLMELEHRGGVLVEIKIRAKYENAKAVRGYLTRMARCVADMVLETRPD